MIEYKVICKSSGECLWLYLANFLLAKFLLANYYSVIMLHVQHFFVRIENASVNIFMLSDKHFKFF